MPVAVRPSHVGASRSLLRGPTHAADGRRPRPLCPAQGRQRVSLRDLALDGGHRPGDDGPGRDPRHHRPPARPRRASPGGPQAAGRDRRRDRRRRRDRPRPRAGGDRRARPGAGRGPGADHHAEGGRRARGRGATAAVAGGLDPKVSELKIPRIRGLGALPAGEVHGADLAPRRADGRFSRRFSSAATRSAWSWPSTGSATRGASTTRTSGCSRPSRPAPRRAWRPPGRWPRSDCRTRSTRPSRSAAAGPASCTTRPCRRWRCSACGSRPPCGRRPTTSCTPPARRPSSRSMTRS